MEQRADHVRSHPVERVLRMNVLVSGQGNSLPEDVMAEVEADLVESFLGISIPDQVLVVGEERLEPRDIPGDEEATTAQDEPGSVKGSFRVAGPRIRCNVQHTLRLSGAAFINGTSFGLATESCLFQF